MSKCGGFGPTTDVPDVPDVVYISYKMKPQVEVKTGKNFEEFIPTQYSSQVVAGTNYLIKVHVGGESYIHLLVFQDLLCRGGKISLSGVQEDKTKDDKLEPF
ncbi:cystatin-A5-like [Scomber japonicus]|uniref:cystatin-A5-like n=1 Tax=Scomber japonicus TaxID=13676 RepID=UPI002306161E|nr:cystatin-A5-like [Scomber japonicus]